VTHKPLTIFISAVIFLSLGFSTAQAQAPTNGLISHWSFDETSGTTASDPVSGNDGILQGGMGDANWVAGQVGNALNFDGTNDFVNMGDPSNGSLDFGDKDDFSIAGWVNNSETGPGRLVGKKAGTGSAVGYLASINSLGVLSLSVDSTGNYNLTSLTNLSANTWYHFVFLWDADGIAQLYINGVLDTNGASTAAVGDISNAQPFRLGAESDGESPFQGQLDEVRIYNRALSSQEVQDLYNAESGASLRPPPPPSPPPSPPDTTPPVPSNGSPSGILPAGTTSTTLSLDTDEDATCRYSTTSGVEYASMTDTFSPPGGMSHSATVSGLADGTTYNYYIRCQDTVGNTSTTDFLISFSVDFVVSPPPPPSDYPLGDSFANDLYFNSAERGCNPINPDPDYLLCDDYDDWSWAETCGSGGAPCCQDDPVCLANGSGVANPNNDGWRGNGFTSWPDPQGTSWARCGNLGVAGTNCAATSGNLNPGAPLS